jgi:hypothetical protein
MHENRVTGQPNSIATTEVRGNTPAIVCEHDTVSLGDADADGTDVDLLTECVVGQPG